MVETRIKHHKRVSTWFAGRWRNHQLKRAKRPHSNPSRRKALGGPATRPETPRAAENSVGKPAARLAPNVGMGKRAWRTPTPHFVPVRPSGLSRDILFSAGLPMNPGVALGPTETQSAAQQRRSTGNLPRWAELLLCPLPPPRNRHLVRSDAFRRSAVRTGVQTHQNGLRPAHQTKAVLGRCAGPKGTGGYP
jgi:hypothetical protein